MTELKKGRWVKVYEQGKANSAEENDNVMDITLGENRAQAEVTYTVRTHRKAASWLIKYLEAANAVDVLAAAAERILAEVSDEDGERDGQRIDTFGGKKERKEPLRSGRQRWGGKGRTFV